MLNRSRFYLLAAVMMTVGLLALVGVAPAQGRRERAFERVREVQERHTERMMVKRGVVGTAVGVDEAGEYTVLILLEEPEAREIPREMDGVPVQPVITGTIQALAQPRARPTVAARDASTPAAPTGLRAEVVSGSQILLSWSANRETDLDHYSVYRSVRLIGPYSKIGTAPAGLSPFYSDEGLRAATTFYYLVTAVDTSGNQSRRSDYASAQTPGQISIGPRPAPIGVSTGHPDVAAGTLGCRVRREMDGTVLYYALSNNHVYADENRASLEDIVLQPGPYDGGQSPRDGIGILADFEPIVFSREAANLIDAAIALCSPRMLGNSTPDGSYTPSQTIAVAVPGLVVQKFGRTTGLTHGQVYAVNATVDVEYDTGTARFVRQIVIAPEGFCLAGDSGSLIVTEDGNHPVGLLFAGSDSYTIANPIDLVLARFGVMIDGL